MIDRPAKHLRFQVGQCVVFSGIRPGRRDASPFSLPPGVLRPYYKSLGSHSSFPNENCSSYRNADGTYVRNTGCLLGHHSPINGRNLSTLTDDISAGRGRRQAPGAPFSTLHRDRPEGVGRNIRNASYADSAYAKDQGRWPNAK